MKIVRKYDVPLAFYIFDVKDHAQIKPKILNDIAKLGVNPVTDNGQLIANTDWHLPRETHREYITHIYDTMQDVCRQVNEIGEDVDGIKVDNYWFQQYAPHNYHGWHIHGMSVYSCVYYVDTDEATPRTSFKMLGSEFEVEAEEGQILVFPSFLLHASKPNTSSKTKTVIAFNLG